MTKERIYQKELDRLLNEGTEPIAAERMAAERAEEIYWQMVDDARAEAKWRG